MAVVGSILTKFTAETAEFTSGAEKLRAEARATNEAIAEGARKGAAQTRGAYRDALDSIKGDFGRGSTFEETMKLLRGGGAVLGVTELGRQLGEFTGKIREMADAIKEGKKNWQELALGMAEGLPVLGGFATFGKNVAYLATGFDPQAQGKMQKDLDEFQKKRDEVIGELNKQTIDLSRQMDDFNSKERIAAEADAFWRRRLEVIDEYRKQLRAIRDTVDEQVRKSPIDQDEIEKSGAARVAEATREKDVKIDQIDKQEAVAGYDALMKGAKEAAGFFSKAWTDAVSAVEKGVREQSKTADEIRGQFATRYEKIADEIRKIQGAVGPFGLNQAEADKLKMRAAAAFLEEFKPDVRGGGSALARFTSLTVNQNDPTVEPIKATADHTRQMKDLLTQLLDVTKSNNGGGSTLTIGAVNL